jgi:all-trans-retinol 13,14-reductase
VLIPERRIRLTHTGVSHRELAYSLTDGWRMTDCDDIVIGTGMGGLTVGAMLARSGRRVLMLEAHDQPGGYAHTFRIRGFRFCAQVHYLFNCGEGESIHNLLSALDVADRVPFVRLDPEGFDHIVIDGERVRVPNGLAKYRDRLTRRYPQHAKPLREYFRIVGVVGDELDRIEGLPDRITRSLPLLLSTAYEHRHLVRYRRWTLEDLYDQVKMPPRLRAFLAGQCGDYLLPPRDVSFLLHVALVRGYDRGAYYPRKHYFHFVETIAASITSRLGCAILFEHAVDRIHVEEGKVSGVTTTNGKRFTASRYISNVDPRATARLAGEHHFARDAKKLAYDYSCGTFTMYLAVKGLDLRDHGFGSWNTWHYPHEDINRIYDDQLVRHDLSNPWLFMSTPTLHSDAPGLCPPGHQILEIATCCDHARLDRMRVADRRAYNHEKKKIRERILDVVEAAYVPNLRAHVALRLAGTPTTNERFCRAPEGNAYGSALTPANVGYGRRPYKTALDNLWIVNATAGFPSVAGTVAAGLKLFQSLS